MNEKLNQLIQSAESLKNSDANSPEFGAWYDNVIRNLKKLFGTDSHEVNAFTSITFYNFEGEVFNGREFSIELFQKGLQQAILYLKNYEHDFEYEYVHAERNKKIIDKKNIFIIHGRDENIKAQVTSFLLKIKLNPIILNEQTNKGKTIIEKFEEHSNVVGAIALFTSDDIGKYKDDKDYEIRARQNVIFEAGYFIGKLGRKKTIILFENGLNIPSDLLGYVYVPLDPHKRWHFDLAKELKDMGFDVDLNNM